MISVDKVIEAFRNGDVILLPTDTVAGLAAKPDIPGAVEKIYSLKQRPREMNLPIMVSSRKHISDLGLEINENAQKLLGSKYMPGAVTIVLGFKDGLLRPEWLNERDEVAIRIPNDKLLLDILNQVGPLLVTSANLHGCKNIHIETNKIKDELNGLPDVVVEGATLKEIPSTIVNCRGNDLIIERLGVISEAEIMNILKSE